MVGITLNEYQVNRWELGTANNHVELILTIHNVQRYGAEQTAESIACS